MLSSPASSRVRHVEAPFIHPVLGKYDAKLPASFNSLRWQRGYNPDLIFVSNNISSLCEISVCASIPNTQHRPIACLIQATVKPTVVPFRHRFNFLKANWQLFSETIDSKLLDLDPTPNNYNQFVDIVWTSSHIHIPRGRLRLYIPGLTL